MAITRIGAGVGARTSGTTATFNGPNVTTSDAHTLAVVGVTMSISSNSTSVTCSVTWGGTSMTQLSLTQAGSSTSRNAAALYYLFNPPTGTSSIVATPGGSASRPLLIAQGVAFSGVDTAGVGSIQTAASTTHAPTSVANGYDIRLLSNGAVLSSPNQTNEYLDGTNVLGAGDYGVMQSAAGTGSTISFTCSGTATQANSIAVALSPYTAVTAYNQFFPFI